MHSRLLAQDLDPYQELLGSAGTAGPSPAVPAESAPALQLAFAAPAPAQLLASPPAAAPGVPPPALPMHAAALAPMAGPAGAGPPPMPGWLQLPLPVDVAGLAAVPVLAWLQLPFAAGGQQLARPPSRSGARGPSPAPGQPGRLKSSKAGKGRALKQRAQPHEDGQPLPNPADAGVVAAGGLHASQANTEVGVAAVGTQPLLKPPPPCAFLALKARGAAARCSCWRVLPRPRPRPLCMWPSTCRLAQAAVGAGGCWRRAPV